MSLIIDVAIALGSPAQEFVDRNGNHLTVKEAEELKQEADCFLASNEYEGWCIRHQVKSSLDRFMLKRFGVKRL